MDFYDPDFALEAVDAAFELDRLTLHDPSGVSHLVSIYEYLTENIASYRQEGTPATQFVLLLGYTLEECERLTITRQTKVTEVYDQLEVVADEIKQILDSYDRGLEPSLLLTAASLRGLLVVLSRRSSAYFDRYRRGLVAA